MITATVSESCSIVILMFDLLRSIDHPSIMKLIDTFEDTNYVHIITEKCTGGEVLKKILDNTTDYGCLPECKAAKIIKSLLEAVAYLHDNGVVHRDIKPENILFETTQEENIKLIDFGLSRRHEKGDALMNGYAGTAYYMSPEVLDGKYDASCDLWSVGTVAFMLVCGYPRSPAIVEAIKNRVFDLPYQQWSSRSDEALYTKWIGGSSMYVILFLSIWLLFSCSDLSSSLPAF